VRITVKSENGSTLDENLLDYAEEKIGKIEKFYSNIQEADLVLSELRGRNVAEVTIKVSGKIIRAETEGSNIRGAIDRLSDKLETQMRKYKERQIDLSRKSARTAPIHEANLSVEKEKWSDIVREKKFFVEPMSDEEAIEQIELLGHDFFLYYRMSGKNNHLALLYRRKTGGFGVLIPEIK
jgi:putative sigma-54 modulation protein